MSSFKDFVKQRREKQAASGGGRAAKRAEAKGSPAAPKPQPAPQPPQPVAAPRPQPPAAAHAHRDAAFSRRGLTSFVTVQIYLNDGGRDFDGGETRFVGKDRRGAPEDYEDVVPRVGRLLYFDHDLLHEGRLVTRGVKYAIRTELMFEPDT